MDDLAGSEPKKGYKPLHLVVAFDHVFLVENLEVKQVTFSVDDQDLSGILRVPDVGRPVPALVFMGPVASVKEQVTGAYAEAMARRGFITLAFDHRHFGHSGGAPRQYEHPGRKVEDLRTAARYVKSQVEVAPLRIGAVGVCAGAGYLAYAAAREKRIKAWASVAGFFHDPKQAQAEMGEDYDEQIRRAMAAREHYERTSDAEMMPAVGGADAAMQIPEAAEYFGTRRGSSPNYSNEVAVMSREHMLLWDSYSLAGDIEIPTMLVHGDQALQPDRARSFYAGLKGPKQELWLDAPRHIDFYDDEAIVAKACDKMANFFRTNM